MIELKLNNNLERGGTKTEDIFGLIMVYGYDEEKVCFITKGDNYYHIDSESGITNWGRYSTVGEFIEKSFDDDYYLNKIFTDRSQFKLTFEEL